MSEDIFIRTYRPEDIPALVTLTNEADACDKMERATTLEEAQHDMATPNYYPETDCFMAWDNGRLVGYADFFLRIGDAESTCYSWGLVHPDWRRRGLGLRLMDKIYRRATERLAELDGGEVHFQASGRSEETDRRALFEAFGIHPVFTLSTWPNRSTTTSVEIPPATAFGPSSASATPRRCGKENLAFKTTGSCRRPAGRVHPLPVGNRSLSTRAVGGG